MLGYTFRFQLLVYSCDTWLLFSFMLCSYLFIMLFSYLLSVVYLIIILCTLVICTSSPLYTHSPGRFLTTLDLHVQILDALFLLCMCSRTRHASRRAGASPYSTPVLSFLSSYYFLILVISDSFVIPVLYSYDIMRGCLYVLLQWSLTHYSINL